MGSCPPSDGFKYALNYGFICGVLAPDGEHLDAYVVGVTEPIAEAAGRVSCGSSPSVLPDGPPNGRSAAQHHRPPCGPAGPEADLGYLFNYTYGGLPPPTGGRPRCGNPSTSRC